MHVILKNYTILFVYGPLMHGQRDNNNYLGGMNYQPAILRDFKLIAPPGNFPIIEHSPGDQVVGEIYMVDSEILARLDRFEGYIYPGGSMSNLFDRVSVFVETAIGCFPADIYMPSNELLYQWKLLLA